MYPDQDQLKHEAAFKNLIAVLVQYTAESKYLSLIKSFPVYYSKSKRISSMNI